MKFSRSILYAVASLTLLCMKDAAFARNNNWCYNGLFPEGPYRNSCDSCQTIGNTAMSAKCLGSDNKFHYTEIKLSSCPSGKLKNHNGKLVCG